MFFFYIGAEFNFHYLNVIIIPAIILSIFVLMGKPLIYRTFLRQVSEAKKMGNEVGVRLGQISEFSLLVVYLALNVKVIGPAAACMVQSILIITFMCSSYLIGRRYRTPTTNVRVNV